jgi:hypothetical protein
MVSKAQSYRLTPIFDPMSIFFFLVHSSFASSNNQNQNAHNIHRVPIFVFLGLPHPSTFFHHVPKLFIFPYPRESLSLLGSYAALPLFPLSADTTHQILAIITDAGQNHRCSSLDHSNWCRTESPKSKFQSWKLIFQFRPYSNFFLALWCWRSNLNVCDLPLGLWGHIETRITSIQETRVTRTQWTKVIRW